MLPNTPEWRLRYFVHRRVVLQYLLSQGLEKAWLSVKVVSNSWLNHCFAHQNESWSDLCLQDPGLPQLLLSSDTKPLPTLEMNLYWWISKGTAYFYEYSRAVRSWLQKSSLGPPSELQPTTIRQLKERDHTAMLCCLDLEKSAS
jgi:hypothetical protein